MKIEFKELNKKSEKELQTILSETRNHLRDLRFKVAQKQLKNIGEIKMAKKTIARILFLLNQRSAAPKPAAGEIKP